MLYYLFNYLDSFDIPGAGVFHYISFRSGMALIVSLIISVLFGNKLIGMLRKMQMGEQVRDLGLEGQKEKEGTPTMGGFFILGVFFVQICFLAKLTTVTVFTRLFVRLWLVLLGF